MDIQNKQCQPKNQKKAPQRDPFLIIPPVKEGGAHKGGREVRGANLESRIYFSPSGESRI